MLAREGVMPATDEDLAEVERRLDAFAFPSFDRDIVERLVMRVRADVAAQSQTGVELPRHVVPELKPLSPFDSGWRKHFDDGWNACVAAMTGVPTR